jgi:hypothetical protein
LKVTTFVGPNTRLNYWNTVGDVDLFFYTLLAKGAENDSYMPAARVVTLHVDDQRYEITLMPDANAEWKQALSCGPIRLSKNQLKSDHKTDLLIGAYLLLEPQDRTIGASIFRRNKGGLDFRGVSGWVVMDELPKSEIGNVVKGGGVGLFSFQGTAERFEVNDEKVEVTKDDHIVFSGGELSLDFSGDSKIVLSGKAQAIFKNRERFSRTRWERLDWPVRAIIFGGVPASLIWLWTVFVSLLTRNESIGAQIFTNRAMISKMAR